VLELLRVVLAAIWMLLEVGLLVTTLFHAPSSFRLPSLVLVYCCGCAFADRRSVSCVSPLNVKLAFFDAPPGVDRCAVAPTFRPDCEHPHGVFVDMKKTGCRCNASLWPGTPAPVHSVALPDSMAISPIAGTFRLVEETQIISFEPPLAWKIFSSLGEKQVA